jgi:hypothetical protein
MKWLQIETGETIINLSSITSFHLLQGENSGYYIAAYVNSDLNPFILYSNLNKEKTERVYYQIGLFLASPKTFYRVGDYISEDRL